jgi:hypothetical protein
MGRSVLVIDKGNSRVEWAPKIMNLINAPDGIKGSELLRNLTCRHVILATGLSDIASHLAVSKSNLKANRLGLLISPMLNSVLKQATPPPAT